MKKDHASDFQHGMYVSFSSKKALIWHLGPALEQLKTERAGGSWLAPHYAQYRETKKKKKYKNKKTTVVELDSDHLLSTVK